MPHEQMPLSDDEFTKFKRLTEGLDGDIQKAMQPTDGQDAVPRANPFDGLIGGEARPDGRKNIPPGHIALQGSIDQE